VSQALGRDPHAGDLYVFKAPGAISSRSSGTTGSACRLCQAVGEGSVHLASPADGVVAISAGSSPTCWRYRLRNPRHTWRRAPRDEDNALQTLANLIQLRAWKAPRRLPDDIAALKAALASERQARREAEAQATASQALVAI